MPAGDSFFDPRLVGLNGVAFLDQAKIDEALLRLLPNARLSKGSFTFPSRAELRDLAWNHMDQNHRPHIHNTYGEAARVFIDRHASFALTRYGRWPIAIPVFDGYFRDNGFYQVMVLFGVIVVVVVIECNVDDKGETRMDVNWTIASHRWLRFLHPILSRRIERLNDVQNREDDPIRDRRVELRAADYRFTTDAPDFYNSNVIGNNVEFPAYRGSHTLSIREIPEGGLRRERVGDRAYILRRTGQSLEVWPGVCPHEGASLDVGNVDGRMVRCPWHGLEFGPRRLGAGASTAVVCGALLELEGDRLSIRPAPG